LPTTGVWQPSSCVPEPEQHPVWWRGAQGRTDAHQGGGCMLGVGAWGGGEAGCGERVWVLLHI